MPVGAKSNREKYDHFYSSNLLSVSLRFKDDMRTPPDQTTRVTIPHRAQRELLLLSSSHEEGLKVSPEDY